MPELPEVEMTRRGVAPHMEGARIVAVRHGLALRWSLGCDAASLVGRIIVKVCRRGKYLVVELSSGYLLIHLGMSGRLLVCLDATSALSKHDHFEFQTTKSCIRLRDPRRFGAVIYTETLQEGLAGKLLSKLGVEPLDASFSVDVMADACRKTRQSIKQLLLCGRMVVGVGNIYACEALYQAGIRPTTPANELSLGQLERLHFAICSVLSKAIALGGSTLRDYAHADGSPGGFQLAAMVYGREGEPCLACGHSITKLVLGQRSTFFCPTCQQS